VEENDGWDMNTLNINQMTATEPYWTDRKKSLNLWQGMETRAEDNRLEIPGHPKEAVLPGTIIFHKI
jgi:hypothetical protein